MTGVLRQLFSFMSIVLSVSSIRGGDDDLGAYEIADVELLTPLPGCRFRYSALVYAAPTGRIRVRPASFSPAALGWYGLTELRCGTCTTTTGGDSRPRPAPHVAHGVPTIAVPLLHASDFPVADFLLRAHWTSTNSSIAGGVERVDAKALTGVAFISARRSHRCSEHRIAALSDASQFSVDLNPKYEHPCLARAIAAGDACALRILGPDEQPSRDVPALVEATQRAEHLHGSWPLRRCLTNCSRGIGWSPSNDERTAATLNALRAGRRVIHAAYPAAIAVASRSESSTSGGANVYAPANGGPSSKDPVQTPIATSGSAVPGRRRRERRDDASAATGTGSDPSSTKRAHAADAKDDTAVPTRPPPSAYAAAFLEGSSAGESIARASDSESATASGSESSDLEGGLSSLEASAVAAAAAIPGLSKILTPILEGVLKLRRSLATWPTLVALQPVVSVVGGIVADTLSSAMETTLSPMIQNGLVSDIAARLDNALTAGLAASLTPSLADTVISMTLDAVPPSVRDEVDKEAANELANALTSSLVQTLAHVIPAEIERVVPSRLSDELSSSLTFLLTQSVTQAIVPALTHTLHHNPAEDFYCAYCAAHQLYCDLCSRGGPEQLTRAEFYAAYYSRHYATTFSGPSATVPAVSNIDSGAAKERTRSDAMSGETSTKSP